MNKLYLAIITLTLQVALSACSPTITSGELQRATDRCKDKGGVEQFIAPTLFAITDFTRLFQVKCNNGELHNVNKS